ncbi:Loss of heterozygosity 12 chromosomal region 1 protein-like protein [Daphnia sinensis]|uniref:BLOC-1-related complex subunit 5 n=1 Tax=Daphnia sinensis TaxID=1820382 RepID=A0AAD5PPZ0_9CRUS|nr:Loss of heterozygosity 12 chromosomal region 1 protein-like protein [Daphnia sinensis]
MGIEQSAPSQSSGVPRNPTTTPHNKTRQDTAQTSDENDRSSPHPSLCSSDVDVPYVSYTVNRPIGESPKHQGKPSTRSAKNYGVSYAPSHPLKGRNIVVVSQKSMLDEGEEDSEILNLGRIPLFLPIIRSSLSTTHPREPDIVDRLDSGALQSIVGLLEGLMKQNADLVASDQTQLAQSSKDIEAQLAAIMMALTERQKLYAKYAEKLARIHEVSHSLTRCHLALATAMDSIETLNRQLPISERLEEFIWSTG